MLFQFGIVDQYYFNFEIEIPNFEFQICYFFSGRASRADKNVSFFPAERCFAMYFHDLLSQRELTRSASRKITYLEFQF